MIATKAGVFDTGCPPVPHSKFELVETTPADAATIAAFLTRAFRLPPEAPLVSPAYLHWKYWAPRPDWAGSRSFLVRCGAAVAAHAAAWPVRIRVDREIVPTIHLIDWAADPGFPGAGVWLLRRLAARARGMLATGGSDATRRILPLVGFRRCGELHCFARPVRPFGQAFTTRARTWRLPAKLLRNFLWLRASPLRLPSGWSAAPFDNEHLAERLWPEPSATMAVPMRGVDLYRYFSSATAVRHVLFGARKRGELVGYFCLAFAGHIARIADLWVVSDGVADWCEAVRTAAVTAAGDERVYEISAWAATPLVRKALDAAGFRSRECTTVSIAGDVRPLDGRTLHLQMLDCDASVLPQEPGSYLTC